MVMSMICLLKNNFCSLKRNWVYWLTYVVVFLYHFLLWTEGDMSYYRSTSSTPSDITMCIMSFAMILIFVLAAVIPFIVGTEFDGGVIRNKIMAGFSKMKIYMATWITCLVATLGLVIFNLVITFIMFCMGQGTKNVITVLGYSYVSSSVIGSIVFLLVIAIGVMSFSCAVTYVIGKKAIAIIACIVIVYIGAIDPLALRAYADDSPEYFTYIDYDTGIKKEVPNQFYLPAGSPLKKVVIALDSINVFETGLLIEDGYNFDIIYIYDGKEVSGKDISGDEYKKMIEGPYGEKFEFNPKYICGALAFSVLTTAGGIIIFKKRNIK